MDELSVKELLAESSLALTGTVEQANASAVPDPPVDDRHTLLKTDNVTPVAVSIDPFFVRYTP